MATSYQDPYGIGTGIGAYYGGALANDPRLPAINRNIAGQIAPDVRNQLGQAAAERGIGIGSYGGGNDQSSLLRALGLTSMDLTNKGVGQYGDAYNSVPKLDPTSLFVNPTTIFNDTASLRDLQLKLAADKAQQAAQIAAQERMQANSLAASGSQFASSMGTSQNRFNTERSDALSAKSSSNARLQGIIDRNSGGGKTPGTGGGTAATVGSTPASWGNWGSQVRMNAPLPDAYYGGVSGYYDGGTSDPYWDNPSTNAPIGNYGEYSDPYAGGFVDETYPAWEDQFVDW